MKKMLISGIITVTIIAVTGVIFYACKKDSNDKVTKNLWEGTTVLENPMDQYGIWHNECIKHMALQGAVDLTMEELWETHGIEYFMEVFETDYTPLSLDELHALYEDANNIVVNKHYLNLLETLVDAGRINPYIDIQNLIENEEGFIRRNNYNILLDYFTFLTDYTVTSETTYWIAYNKLCEIEQEMLTNYYDLLNSGLMSLEDDVCVEYEEVLLGMAIARNSAHLWAQPSDSPDAIYALANNSRYVDMIAAYEGYVYYGPSRNRFGYTSDAAFCSAMAARNNVEIYIDGICITAW
jgi:hypothetical protein